MPTPIRYLSLTVLEGLQLTYQKVIDSIEHLIHGRSQSQVWNTPKAVITPSDGRYMMATLAAANDPPFLAVKTLLLNPENPKRGIKSIHSLCNGQVDFTRIFIIPHVISTESTPFLTVSE